MNVDERIEEKLEVAAAKLEKGMVAKADLSVLTIQILQIVTQGLAPSVAEAVAEAVGRVQEETREYLLACPSVRASVSGLSHEASE